MAVDTKPITIDPYQTTVPLVPLQVPEGDTVPKNSQAPPAFKGKAAGIATIGDSLLRGFLAGHAQKEARKYAQASAAINAGQAAEQSAYQTYQDSIVAGKSPDEQKALYENYQGIYQKNTEAMQQFAVPEKKSKSKDGGKPKGEGKDSKDKSQGQGFGGKIKDFFEANPHLVPQIAILTRAAGMRQLGLSPEGQAKQLELKKAQNQSALADLDLQDEKDKRAAQQVVGMYASLTPEQVDALPADEKKKLFAAKALLYPPRTTGTEREYTSPDGKQRDWFVPGQQPRDWNATAGDRTASAPKGEEAFVAEYVKKNNLDAANLDPATRKYLHDVWTYRNPQSTSTTSSPSHLDAQGNQVPGSTTSTRAAAEPKPPAGVSPVGAETQQGPSAMTPPPKAAAKGTGGISSPPKGTAQKRAASGPITPPPGRQGRGTWQQTQNTERVNTEVKKMYDAAESKYTSAVNKNQAAYQKAVAGGKDAKEAAKALEAANKQALETLNKEKSETQRYYESQVKAVGGTPGTQNQQPPAGATMVYKDKNGVVKGYAVNGQFVPVGQ